MKKSIVFVFGVIVILCFLVFTFGWKKDEKEIAVLLYDLEDPFIKSVGEYLMEYNDSDYNITLYDCKKSQILQNEIAEDLYSNEVDLMIINPVERLSSFIFTQKAVKEEIPIIFFNREPLKNDLKEVKNAYYVGANAVESGVMQANLISEIFGKDNENLNHFDKNADNVIQCVILKGEQGHQDAEQRSTAVIEELKREGYRVEVLLTKIANWNEDEAYRAMSDIMDELEDSVELIISNNDAMAIGVTKYLIDNNYYGKEVNGEVTSIPFPVVGIDGLEEAIELIEKGYMFGTIINDGSSMAKAILELSKYIIDNEDLDMTYDIVDNKYIWIPYKNYRIE